MRFENVPIDPNFAMPKLISMIQDRFGFLWIVTYHGLYQYDGYEFKRFHHIENDTKSLPTDKVNSIVEDQTGDLWVGTNNGYLCRFDRNTEKFRSNGNFRGLNTLY